MRQNDALANQFVEEFIGRSIQDQLIPDILSEVVNEIDQEVCSYHSLESS